jgi:hypothetical protein
VVNALELAQMLGDDRRLAPAQLIERFPEELADFRAERPMQDALFHHFGGERPEPAVLNRSFTPTCRFRWRGANGTFRPSRHYGRFAMSPAHLLDTALRKPSIGCGIPMARPKT